MHFLQIADSQRSRKPSAQCVPRVLLVALLGLALACTGTRRAAGSDATGAVGQVRQCQISLARLRDNLAARLDARLAADNRTGPAHDVILRLAEGADHEEMHARLRMRGGRWVDAYAVVPAWRQETFQEKFRYLHRGGTFAVTRDKIRFPIDAEALTLNGSLLRGTMTAALRLNRLREQRLPPGTPVRWKNTGERFTWMERMDVLAHQRLLKQRYSLDLQVRENMHEFALAATNGIPKHNVSLRFQVPPLTWVHGVVRTPTFNGGFHAIDSSGLSFAHGRLSGTLKVTFNPDKWFPKNPARVVYDVHGTVASGWLTGRFEATGDLGEFTGTLDGPVGLFVEGRYMAEGDMGAYGSAVHGRLQPVRSNVTELIASADPPATTGDAVSDAALRLANTYHELRAVHMALQQHPVTVEEALRQTTCPAPRSGEGATTADDAAHVVDHARRLVALAQAAVDEKSQPAVVRGMPSLADQTFGPFYGSLPLQTNDEGPYPLPSGKDAEGGRQWRYVPAWQVVGPLPRVDDMDHNLAELPEVIPSPGARYPINVAVFPKKERPEGDGEILRGWETVESPSGKLSPAWSEDRVRGGFAGSVWFAAAEIESPQDRELWISVAACDHGKLWVNGQLVWTADEMLYRTHQGREAIFKIRFRKGTNRLLLRCRQDRGSTWARLHFCVKGDPQVTVPADAQPDVSATRMVDQRGDGSGRFPDAEPPLAWDLEKGVNVSWRAELPEPIRSGPVAVDGRLLVCTSPHNLYCLDQKTGRVLWHRETNVLETRDDDSLAKWKACRTQAEKEQLFKTLRMPFESGNTTPISDGTSVWVLYDTGVAAGYTLDGKRQWIRPIDLPRAAMCGLDGNLVIEGSNNKPPVHSLMMLDGQTGNVVWRTELSDEPPRGRPEPWVVRIATGEKIRTAVLTSSLKLLDPANGDVLLDSLDADPAPGSNVHVADDTVYFGKLSRTYAVRFFVGLDGRIGHRMLWRNHYGIKYDRPARCFAVGPWFMTSCTVQEDCKGHSNAAFRELNVFNRRSGEPVKRIKPLLSRSETDYIPPTSAGRYVFVQDAGGGHAGGHPTSGQMAVVDTAGTPRLVCRNLIELGTSKPPVFDGSWMFLRQGQNVTCVAVETEEGRKYQQEKIAATLFDELRDPPKSEEFTQPEPLAELPNPRKVPVARLISDEGIVDWLAAGPLPMTSEAHEEEQEAFARLRPEIGSSVELGGATATFQPLPMEQTQSTFSYGHSYYLCGLGGTIAQLQRSINLSACTGGDTTKCGLLYTVVHNSRQRVAALLMPPAGIDIWLGGKRVRAYDSVQLVAGAYPLLVRVRPDYFPGPDQISVSFREGDDPKVVRRVWLSNLNERESELKGTARVLRDTPWQTKSEQFIEELDEFKTWRDLADLDRGALNDGSGRFPNARPPARWERQANLRWHATLPAAGGSAPVASGKQVYVGVDPNALVCVSRDDGRILWQVAISASGNKGGSVATPAVAGNRVVTAAGDGTVVCVQIDGTLVWKARVSAARAGSSHAPAVVVANGVVVIKVNKLHGLDLRNGKTLWTAENGGKGPPVLAELGRRSVVVTDAGGIISLADGMTLVAGETLGGSFAPHVHGDVLYSVGGARGNEISASRLPPQAVAGATLASLWKTKLDRPIICGPLAHDDLVYAQIEQNKLCVLNAVTGELLSSRRLGLSAHRDGSPTDLLLVGRQLYVTNLGEDCRTLVLDLGKNVESLWEYAVPGGCAAPFFLEREQYIRAGETLFAIGGFAPHNPGEYKAPPEVESPAGSTLGHDAPVAAFESNVMSKRWLLAGPFRPRSLEVDFLTGIGGRDRARPAPGTKVKHKEGESLFRPLAPEHFWRDVKFTSGFDAIGVLGAVDGEMECTVYLYTVVDNPQPRFVELQILTPGGLRWNTPDRLEATAFIGGRQVHEGEVVHLDAGATPLMVQVSLGSLKGGGKIWLAPRLIDRTATYAAERERYEEKLKTWQAYQQAAEKLFVLEP